MKERPILFSAPMVRAILEGKKTVTRRTIKPQPVLDCVRNEDGSGHCRWLWKGEPLSQIGKAFYNMSPYGAPGDWLWVRETFRPVYCLDMADGIQYRADGQMCVANVEDRADGCRHHRMNQAFHWNACIEEGWDEETESNNQKWMPSIHMPKWAARILLEVVSVRAERLQDITQCDAIAEGMPPSHPSVDRISQGFGYPDFSRSAFAQTWDACYGKGAWDANPWVWRVEFKPVEVSHAD